MDVQVDASELNTLAADLVKAGPLSSVLTRKAVQVTAHHVRDDARAFAQGIGHAPAYPSSISYETRELVAGIEAEIGPRVGGPQWGLGDILEYGTPRSAPHAHLGPALDKNTPDFLLGIGLAAEQSMRL
jgi:hypothetical protein